MATRRRSMALSPFDRFLLSGIVHTMEVHSGPYWLPRRNYRRPSAQSLSWVTREIEEGLTAGVAARRRLLLGSLLTLLVVNGAILAVWLGALLFAAEPPPPPLDALGFVTVVVIVGRKLGEATAPGEYLGYALIPLVRDLYDEVVTIPLEARLRVIAALDEAGYTHVTYLLRHSWSIDSLLDGG